MWFADRMSLLRRFLPTSSHLNGVAPACLIVHACVVVRLQVSMSDQQTSFSPRMFVNVPALFFTLTAPVISFHQCIGYEFMTLTPGGVG